MAKTGGHTEAEVDKLVTAGLWKTTISEVWDRNATETPTQDAIEDERTALTWGDARQWIDRVALSLIEAELERDEVVAVQLPNSVELHLLRVACEKAGIRCLPIISNMRESEMKYSLEHTNAAAAVIPRTYRGFDYVDMLETIRPALPRLKHIFVAGSAVPEGYLSLSHLAQQPIEKRYPHDFLERRRYQARDASLICLTTGTTGFPKFVDYPAAAYGIADDLVRILKLTINDVVAPISPAARGPNSAAYFAAPRAKAKIVMLPWAGPKDALQWIEKKRITVVCLVPAQLAMMEEEAAKQHYDLTSVRIWLCAGSLLPPSLAEAVERKMGGTVLSQYGAVDFGLATIPLPDDSFQTRATTVGRPWFGTEVKIADDSSQEVEKGATGEVTLKSHYSAFGYYRDSEANEAAWSKDGWFLTGDLGKLDEHGNLVIVGRKKDFIIRGGQNIYPVEVESLLVKHPKVKDVAVVAMPDPVMGEKACAYVVLKGEEHLTLEDMVTFLKEKKVAPFKLPERLEIIDALPMVSEQKVDKKALRQDIANKLSSETK
ncbi:MAG: AMP-binding protein [Chloroflexi bacterium]|nr:AMP-binding protein [Chloroflexota bacterium]